MTGLEPACLTTYEPKGNVTSVKFFRSRQKILKRYITTTAFAFSIVTLLLVAVQEIRCCRSIKPAKFQSRKYLRILLLLWIRVEAHHHIIVRLVVCHNEDLTKDFFVSIYRSSLIVKEQIIRY